MKTLYAFLCIFLVSSVVHATTLTADQENILRLAHHYGEQIEFRGDTFGETMAAIAYQESKGGWVKYQRNGLIVGDRSRKGHYKSLGPLQVQLPAARDIERWYPEIFKGYFGMYSPTDEELIVALLTNMDFNVQCGAAYFKKMLLKKKSWSKAILAYNRGASNDGTDPNNYVALVKKWRLKIIQPLIKK